MVGELSVAAFDAAEMLTHAALRHDPHLAAEAREKFDAVARTRAAVPDAALVKTVTESDPMVAATLGWLDTPELIRRVSQSPATFLDADEAAAFAIDPSVLRVAVLARIAGQSFVDALADTAGVRSDYALAARGDAEDVQAIFDELRNQGVFDDPDE